MCFSFFGFKVKILWYFVISVFNWVSWLKLRVDEVRFNGIVLLFFWGGIGVLDVLLILIIDIEFVVGIKVFIVE